MWLVCVCVCVGWLWLWSAHLSALRSLLPGRLTALLYGGSRHRDSHSSEGKHMLMPTYWLIYKRWPSNFFEAMANLILQNLKGVLIC